MTRRDRIIKNIRFFWITTYYLGVYYLINLFTATRSQHHQLEFFQESAIPFYPVFLLGYVMIFVIIGYTYVGINDGEFFKKVVRTFAVCLTIHFICFLVFPVEYVLRPEIDPSQGWMYQAVHFYYWYDLPYNCFPSLHVSNAFLCAFMLGRYQKRLGWIFIPMAVLVALSVVLVRQHYIIDVIAGFLVAAGLYWFMWCRRVKAV